jgi:hypothetical protein
MTLRFAKYVPVGCALVLAALSTATRPRPQRDCCPGDWWKKWSQAQRESYVVGYTTGFDHGFTDGCNRGTKDWPVEVKGYDNLPINKCLSGHRDFSRPTEFFISRIGEFYAKYPKESASPDEVLDLLGQGLSPDQIHRDPSIPHGAPGEKP